MVGFPKKSKASRRTNLDKVRWASVEFGWGWPNLFELYFMARSSSCLVFWRKIQTYMVIYKFSAISIMFTTTYYDQPRGVRGEGPGDLNKWLLFYKARFSTDWGIAWEQRYKLIRIETSWTVKIWPILKDKRHKRLVSFETLSFNFETLFSFL